MKYLSYYTDEATSKALKDNKAFFAFSDKQFHEAKEPNIKYISLGSGLIAPEQNAKQLLDDLDNALKNGIQNDIKENGIENIIKRELANHEAYYTGEIDDTLNALKAYNITAEQVQELFNKERVKYNA